MKEHVASAVYCEKVCLCLQCNYMYEQLWLNLITIINELSLVIYEYRISEGEGK